ncbi:MAG: lytic transglycosylase domain-containing protein, partial [Pelagibacteraceae bacterium]
MAGLIKPEPKPIEFQNLKENKKLSKPVKKIEKIKDKIKVNKKEGQVEKKITKEKKQSEPKKEVLKKEKIVEKKEILKKDDDYSVSNQILPVKKPLDLGIKNKTSKILSPKDFKIAQKTFNLIKRKRWNSAMVEVGVSSSPILKNLVTWMYLKEPQNKATFYDYNKFIKKNSQWPRIGRLRYLAEHKIDFKLVKPN